MEVQPHMEKSRICLQMDLRMEDHTSSISLVPGQWLMQLKINALHVGRWEELDKAVTERSLEP